MDSFVEPDLLSPKLGRSVWGNVVISCLGFFVCLCKSHLGAALSTLRYAFDTHYPWQEDEILVGGKLRIENGSVQLPDGPGLGVELDRAALARAHARYLACGLVRRDDEAEMQKKQPGWRFQKTRY